MNIDYPKNASELKILAVLSVIQKTSVVSKNNIAEILENSSKFYEYLGGDSYDNNDNDISKITDFIPQLLGSLTESKEPVFEPNPEPSKKKTTKTS